MTPRGNERKVLVTGGAGFIGSHIVDAYLKAGHEVAVVDNLATGRRENLNPGAAFYELDIGDPALADVFRREQPDYVNHHAAQASVRRSVEDPAADAGINLIGSLKLLELAREHRVKKFIFASTGGAIYGEQDYFPADEAHPVRPVSPYGCAKAAVEIYLHYYYHAFGLEYVALRYANIYGPRQDPFGEAGVVAIFANQLLAGARPTINGTGRQTRDFVYVGDVVRADMLAMEAAAGVYNIGTGIETSVVELYSHLGVACRVDTKPSFGPPRPGEQFRSVLDAGLARKALGWTAATPLDEGLRATVDFFRQAPVITGRS